MNKQRLLNVNITAQPFDHAIFTLKQWAVEPTRRAYICACPVYTLMQGYERQDVRDALNNADMVIADGMPIVWLLHRHKQTQAERVYGPDVLHALCKEAAHQPHYFYGGAPGIASKVAEFVRETYGTRIAGSFSPPYRPLEDTPDWDVIHRLNDSGAAIIWVGLGSPKQDLWMQRYRPHLNAQLLIGVGAAFDFVAGTKKQAPRWMQRSGLEWAFRLAQEPRRLWRRYVIYNTKFILAVMRETVQGRRR